MSYYIKAILLDNCKYSIAANNLLILHNINCQIINVNASNKLEYKTNQINTFPQIYLCKDNTLGSLLLGGYEELSNFISTFKENNLNNDNIKQFMNKYKWSKKATLRLIQIINK
jgi:hypothetical protein